VSHSPVATAIVAGAEGFATGGIEGAFTAIGTQAIAAFTRNRPPLFGAAKEAIGDRWQTAIRPFITETGRLAIKAQIDEALGGIGFIRAESKRPQIEAQIRSRFRNDNVAWNRRGARIWINVFAQLSISEIETFLDRVESGAVVLRRDQPQVEQIVEQGAPDPETLAPVGEKPMVSKIDRADFNQGLQGEILSQGPSPDQISQMLIPTLEIGRYLPQDAVADAANQFFSDVAVALSTNVTGLRISAEAKKGKAIYIRRGHLSITPNSFATSQYRFFAGAARKGEDTVETKMHFEVLRKSSGLGIDSGIADIEFGGFSVPLGKDYLMRMENLPGGAIRMSGSVEAFFIPIGVNGSKC